MRIIYGAEEARRTVLRRRPMGQTDLPPAARELIRAVSGAELSAQEVVERILADVRAEGDAAVRRYSRAFDGVDYASLEVPRAEIEAAYREVEPPLVDALRLAADRIRAFHEVQRRHGPVDFFEGGLGVRVRPLERVGVYVPGTVVVYPSSVLMTAIPARVADVDHVYMASPASADGRVSPLKLVAADIAGVDRVFRASGALDLVLDGVRAAVGAVGADTAWVDGLPTAFMKPLSGSGARGMMIETASFRRSTTFRSSR